jgi:hypothetical protein
MPWKTEVQVQHRKFSSIMFSVRSNGVETELVIVMSNKSLKQLYTKAVEDSLFHLMIT